MNKEFIPYKQALELKELGFNEPCFGLYAPPSKTIFLHHYGLLSAKEQILGPLYQQAFRWFRKESGIEGFVHKSIEGNYYFVIKRLGNNESNIYEFTKTAPKTFDVYEEAELACLQKLISIVKEKKL